MTALALLFTMSAAVRADDQTTSALTGVNLPVAASTATTRYGLFGWLDHRSAYGQGVFPEPFLVDDSDGESNEARLDWFHTGGPGNQHTDMIHGEVEKGFGPLTLELESAWERDSSSGQISSGMDNVDLGARCPFYEYVSSDGTIDSTFGTAIEVGIPTHTEISHNTEVVPKLFNDLQVWQDFTLQSIIGYSTLLGHGGQDGGLQTFEYGFVFGYTIEHDKLAITGLQQLIPVFEFNGGKELNQANPGHDSLTGDVGFRANLDAIGPIQPRLGIVFVFPIDNGASQDQTWGIDTSLVFEY
ncbi:MAG TPA: hypothetical protein VGZ93_09480 [Candidatus Methylacidiphilales bacterium]|nr:hypothetical protein [Candidatus Methylacidiphilales bacterium]